jgi:hypothetical protein
MAVMLGSATGFTFLGKMANHGFYFLKEVLHLLTLISSSTSKRYVKMILEGIRIYYVYIFIYNKLL